VDVPKPGYGFYTEVRLRLCTVDFSRHRGMWPGYIVAYCLYRFATCERFEMAAGKCTSGKAKIMPYNCTCSIKVSV
jgi:hypothetical protein